MNLFLIVKSNLKKKKSSIILLFVLITIATMLLYTGLSVITNVGNFLDEKNENKNGADLVVISNQGYDKQINNILKSYKGYKGSESETCLVISGADIRNITKDDKPQNMTTLFLDGNKEREISKMNAIEGDVKLKGNSIVLPAYLKVSSGYEVGDEIEVIGNNDTYRFKVAGFSEDVMFSSPSNVTMFKCYIDGDKLDSLENDGKDIIKQQMYVSKLKDNYDSSKYESYVKNNISKKITDPTFMINGSMNYKTMKMGSSMFINIMMSIISVFALLIIIISLIVIRFNIVSNIQSNIQNIGVLQSLGYTSKQLKYSTIIEYMLVSVGGIISGIIISQVSSKFIAAIVSSAVGLIWQPKFDILCAILSSSLSLICVAFITILTSSKYKKITPLMALRNGINTHNFNKNYLPLKNSPLGINSSLGIKSILQNKKQNISICIIVAILSFTCIFSVGIYYNFVMDKESIEEIVGFEKPNILLESSNKYSGDDLSKCHDYFEEINNKEEVEDATYYTMTEGKLINKDKEVSLNIDVVSDMSKLRINNVVEGRLPKHDNEITVTNKVLQDLNAKVGDVIYLESKNKKKDFIVVGISQQISGLGIGAKINEDGMRRLEKDYKGSTYYLYLKDGVNTASFVKKLNKEYKDKNIIAANFDDTYNTIMSTFSTALAILSIVFVSITILVIVLILAMLIKMKILKDKKTIGIYKALGYTTKQVLWQVVMSYVPVICLGALIGVIGGKYLIGPLFAISLSTVGIVKARLIIKLDLLIATFIFITIFSLIVSMVLAYKVRKIEPYKMITE